MTRGAAKAGRRKSFSSLLKPKLKAEERRGGSGLLVARLAAGTEQGARDLRERSQRLLCCS